MAVAAEDDRIRRLLARKQGAQAHAMGICGVGLAGVAQLLQHRGWKVSGCDLQVSGAMGEALRRKGILVMEGHGAGHLDAACDLLIRSAAVAYTHPEVQRAYALGVPVVRRGEVLAALTAERPSVAICGTHGKTTTASFTLRLLQVLGADPAWCIGGQTTAMGSVADGAGRGPLVVEADESDGTLARYAPTVLVVTNLDADHLDHFGTFGALEACFAAALVRTRSGIVYCADNTAARALCASHPHALGYGFSPKARLRIARLTLRAERMSLAVTLDDRPLGEVTLLVTGRHNALNAVAALGAVLALGHAPEGAFAALAQLKELPGRRFERVLRQGGIEIISDYAHHPAEIAALVALARLQPARRIKALFQPHRYTRTLALGEAFPPAFAGVDELVLLPVYAASEAPCAGGRIEDLYAIFRRQALARVPVPRLAPSLEAASAWLCGTLREGDLLLVIGAGDVVQVGQKAAQTLREPRPSGVARVADALAVRADVKVHRLAPLDALTTLGVGGCADLLVEVATEAALAAVLRQCREHALPCRLLGSGSNTLVGDLGVRGVVVRLAGAAFGEVAAAPDGSVRAGCAAPGSRLLNRLAEAGLGGLAFMEGIPGTVGGWVAMNAGAHGGCIGAWVRAIRGLKKDGSRSIVNADEAGFAYRQCRALEEMMAVEVVFAFPRGDAAELAAQRRMFRGKRLAVEGRRSAGSVFRNTGPVSAGQLLDTAGCKGLRVGGAEVFARHANVIVTEPGATASDVLALMAAMRERVLTTHGVELVPEVQIWQDFAR
jgi:UDP-N-acetylmuramate--alanine ligase